MLSLVPVPAFVELGGAAGFVLDERTTVSGEADAVAALARVVAQRTGLRPAPADDAAVTLRLVPGGAPESYRVAVDSASVVVEGADAAGLFYAVATLGQLLERSDAGWMLPAAEIRDTPRFAYRGMMLDVARHFHPVATVEAVIDRAAALKLNHLHLHLTDDQGWRLHLRSRPELTKHAAASSCDPDAGGFYSVADYAHLVAYAAERHMTIVPEIDMPGHTHAVGLACPELVEEPVLGPEVLATIEEFGGGVPRTGEPYSGIAVGFSSLRIRDEATYAFLADIIGELAARTPGPYLHIGGDECLGTDPADFAEFISRATAIVAEAGKIPITWHEAGAAANLHPGTIGQYWGFVEPVDGTDEKARAFARNGAQLILSPADAAYLDMKPDADSALGLLWAGGTTSVAESYAWEPTALIDGIAEADVLGVETALWSETIRTLADIDAMIFPRIASAAEIAWSPAAAEHPGRTWESFRARVGGLAPVWTAAGIGFPRSAEIAWADA